ncbi:alpha-hydroxy-acid oxidizing protein [Dactylosporangium vinaceum]|uniref:Alpha-hydroxy acid oxidase n=1 Tax=Dactylosporangium vinaceum TaxID=53362 RepID=A0ABV5M372_9ACTN|nr:alpha-hydroxy acid oxidase [Dactylosporangium vinaceum]UAB99764.1 alpha-hydroxy-acid oxidizing protein [Dactylosporangium vinaceum]
MLPETLSDPYSVLEAQARAKLPNAVFDYATGAAGDETTMRRNVEALDAVTFVPRVLHDVSTVDTTTDVIGGPLAAPLLVAPMGMQGLYDDGAERAMADAAADLGVGFCLSMFGTRSAGEITANATAAVRWRQVYLTRDPGLTAALANAAHAAHFQALVVTVDLPATATRRRDSTGAFETFDNPVAAAAAPALVREPYFLQQLDRRRQDRPGTTAQQLIDALFPNPSATWTDLADLVRRSPLPVIVKGVLHPADARRAVDCGAAAVIVSNHGGSQLDRCVATAEALPAVVAGVGEAVPVYVDSGVRRGNHVAVALALGASAVLVARPALWGLATGGREGARAVLAGLLEELRRTMVMLGVPTSARLRDVPLRSLPRLDQERPATGRHLERPARKPPGKWR